MRPPSTPSPRACSLALLAPLLAAPCFAVAQPRPVRVQLLVTSVAGAAPSAGYLPNGFARGSLARRRGALERCLARAAVVEATPEGAALLRFTLAPDGAVTEVSLEPAGALLSACVREVVRATRFATPEGGPASFVATLYLRRVP